MSKKKMISNYLEPYLRALATPLPEMQEAFRDEFWIIKQYAQDKKVLDMGAGVGRPAHLLQNVVNKIVLIDHDPVMVKIMRERFKGVGNISVHRMEATKTRFKDRSFDMTLATYNFIGCLPRAKDLVPEMKRVTKKGGYVFLCSWRTDKEATRLLKQYYPSIGISIKKIVSSLTTTDHGPVRRHHVDFLRVELIENDLEVVEFGNLGPMWNYAVGRVKD